jgi:hypothetical protein
MAFEVEDLPGDARLFLRVHEQYFVPSNDPSVKRPSSACFKKPELSVNWAKYSSAKETAKPTSAAVVELVARECKSFNQTVIHCPIQDGEKDGPNQAHSEIRGPKTHSTCDKFVRLSKVVWIRNHAPV